MGLGEPDGQAISAFSLKLDKAHDGFVALLGSLERQDAHLRAARTHQ